MTPARHRRPVGLRERHPLLAYAVRGGRLLAAVLAAAGLLALVLLLAYEGQTTAP
ncbi:hypothetical protein IHE55_23335 [Streptomyces pactum]|uniref:Uncharacterized protein n=1 Tax=Streptomyces pactum TaxID=68249 RepID=A0ABS0NQQ5_9ACTN|nr:hypothetical protein [Streptomyces pactum]MBH5337540.1 hypothetical protein [Streptomyces pactum]